MLRRTALAEDLRTLDYVYEPVLHGDERSMLKAPTVLAMMNWTGLRAPYSRPRLSKDNSFTDALFRTAKYRPQFPVKGFADLEQARQSRTRPFIGTNMTTATAPSATSVQRSDMSARTTLSCELAMRSTSKQGHGLRGARRAIHATELRSPSSGSTLSATQ